jgi:hypothetical protein
MERLSGIHAETAEVPTGETDLEDLFSDKESDGFGRNDRPVLSDSSDSDAEDMEASKAPPYWYVAQVKRLHKTHGPRCSWSVSRVKRKIIWLSGLEEAKENSTGLCKQCFQDDAEGEESEEAASESSSPD